MFKKLTNEAFILKANIIHNNFYDYSLTKYINAKTKIIIICKKHGEFSIIPNAHLAQKQGCPKCSKSYCDIDIFIKKANEIHNKIFDYSLVNYINAKHKIKIICQTHGIFEQTPHNHLNGNGCPKCYGKNKTTNDFINEAKLVHGYKYNYSLVNYIGNKVKVKIICQTHGVFEQTPQNHLNHKGCLKCSGRNKTTNDFINEAKLIHGDKYNYSLVNYRSAKIKIKIICQTHGIFEQTSNSHLSGKGCAKCNLSKGEIEINKLLTKKNINFISQHTFDDCKNKRLLPFDFYLPKLNTCIEFHGEQHYKSVEFFGGVKSFKEQQKRDKIKYDYCCNNHINLLIINDIESIEKSLSQIV